MSVLKRMDTYDAQGRVQLITIGLTHSGGYQHDTRYSQWRKYREIFVGPTTADNMWAGEMEKQDGEWWLEVYSASAAGANYWPLLTQHLYRLGTGKSRDAMKRVGEILNANVHVDVPPNTGRGRR